MISFVTVEEVKNTLKNLDTKLITKELVEDECFIEQLVIHYNDYVVEDSHAVEMGLEEFIILQLDWIEETKLNGRMELT